MTDVNLTFTVHEGNSAKLIRAKYEVTNKDKVVYTININGLEIPNLYIVSGDIKSSSIVYIEAIHLKLHSEKQCEIFIEFVKFLLIAYPNKEFTIGAYVLSDRKPLLSLFTTQAYKQIQEFKERVEYVSMDVTIRPFKPVRNLPIQSTIQPPLGMIRLH